MAGEWHATTLGEICELRAGSVFPPAMQGKPTGEYPFAKVSDMNLAANAARIHDANNWVDDADLPQLKAKPFPPGTTVFAKIGEALKANRLRFVVRPTIIDNNMMGAVPVTETVDPRFFFYALSQFDFGEVAGGTALPYLTVSALSQLDMSLPPFDEQRAIAHILGTLDDKIELNRRMSETLEAMARALFKSWFVDFDPVRAKAEGRDPGLPKPLADLFPTRLVNSPLGEIPEGWEVKPLSDCVDVTRGLSYKGSGLSDTGVPMHNLNSIYEGGGYKHDGIKRYDGAYKSHHVAQAGDLIVANTEQGHDRLLIGYAAVVPGQFRQGSLFSHHIYRVRPNKTTELASDYLCHLLNTRVMHDIVSGYANGTTVNMLPIDGLQSPLLVVPPVRALSVFTGIAETARLRHEEMVEESRTLATLRDALLPILISGELRVPDVEHILASAPPTITEVRA